VPRRSALLGFASGVATIVLGFFIDYPPVIGSGLIAFVFGGWLFFAASDRREARSGDR
jgi:hypothetical protein